MKIAIPRYHDEVAPSFDAANDFLIAESESDPLFILEVFTCADLRGVDRVKHLAQKQVRLVICSGINNKYKIMLEMEGVKVISQVTGRVEDALIAYQRGEFLGHSEEAIFEIKSEDVQLADLITWTSQLFKENGYKVAPGPEKAAFPVDLTAEVLCPVCSRPIRVAICCGAHASRVDEEIREFHHAAGGSFHAHIYVHRRSPEVQRICTEFGIQLLDPAEEFEQAKTNKTRRAVPLVQPPIKEHDRLGSTLSGLPNRK